MDDKIIPFNSSETIVKLNHKLEDLRNINKALVDENIRLKQDNAMLKSTRDMLYLQVKRVIEISTQQKMIWDEMLRNFNEIKNKIPDL